MGATLTLMGDRLRVSSSVAGSYARDDATIHDDSRLRTGYGGTTSIETSHGRDDAGLFSLGLEG